MYTITYSTIREMDDIKYTVTVTDTDTIRDTV